MRLQVDDTLAIEVHFNIIDREDGYEDDIRFALTESGSSSGRLFPADEIGFLLSADQADALALALRQAAEESRKIPR
jgi:hypothetical protein